MKRMPPVVAMPLLATLLVWLASILAAQPLPDAHPLWIAQRFALHLSGLLAIVLLSLAMFLSLQAEWLLEKVGGKGARFVAHRFAGIAGIGCGLLHWLIDRSGGTLRSAIGRAGQLPKEKLAGSLDGLRHLAKDAGEWALWLALLLAALALWRLLPARHTHRLHRALPLVYLLLVFHAALLAPPAWWQQASGLLLACALIAGSAAAVQSLRMRVARPANAGLLSTS